MKINVLPIEIANMIAAGEVVERPASVVKELMENSADAGADRITVEIKKGGITFIRVTDNGCGIDGDEVETAFLPHATSKLKSAADLENIRTLGFRGEALASIAAVSHVEIFTKTKEAALGRCVTVEGGEVLENSEAGCSDGTTLIVRNIFYNTPARMKFLKTDSAETSYITDAVTKFVLGHPETAVKFINNGKTVLTTNGSGNLSDCIYTVFGKDYSKNMINADYSDGSVRITGCIGNARIARKDRRQQIFFINSRNITCKTMSAAVSEAYRNTLMTGRFPVCVLNAELDPRLVDVNVHPTKSEVRFSDEKRVYNLVYWAVKNALSDKKYIPEVESDRIVPVGAGGTVIKNAPAYDEARQTEINLLKDAFINDAPPKLAAEPQAEKSRRSEYESVKTKAPDGKPIFYAPPAAKTDGKDDDETDTSRFSTVSKETDDSLHEKFIQNIETAACAEKNTLHGTHNRSDTADAEFLLVGQVFGTFIIIQKNDDMFIIDQHAAHERIYFERLLEEFTNNKIQSQILLLPVTMTLNAVEMSCIAENGDFFEQLGFGVEQFGANSIIIRYTPEVLEEQDIKDAISDIISVIAANRNNAVKELCAEALHIVACKRALKGNHTMTAEEMKSLAEQALSLGDGINTCPHGRPIMIKMSKYALEKQFKRIV